MTQLPQNKMSQEEIDKKVKQIRKVYNEAIAKLKDLGQEQDKIILAHIKKLEQRKIKEIREQIAQAQSSGSY